MKKYSKPIRCDQRGQIVIPKDIRSDLGVEEGTGFLMYTVVKEGILLKKIDASPLDIHHDILNELDQKAEKLDLKRENLKKSIQTYQKVKVGNFELI